MAVVCFSLVEVVMAGLIISSDFGMVRLEARLAVGNLLSLCLSASPLG